MKPLCIDLYRPLLSLTVDGKIKVNGHKLRQGEMGPRMARAEEVGGIPARQRGEPSETRGYQVSRASIMACDDEALRVERAGIERLSALQGQGNNGLRKVAGVFRISFRHGRKTKPDSYIGPHRFGRQL